MSMRTVEGSASEFRRNLSVNLRRISALGANVIVGWRYLPAGIEVAHIPSYDLPLFARKFPNLLRRNRQLSMGERFEAMLSAGCRPETISMVQNISQGLQTTEMINETIRRYSVTHSVCRCVALFDIVSFSIHSPFKQITQISVLSHYIRLAARRISGLGMKIDLCMTTTGDGFYIWNAHEGLDNDVALFCTAMLALAYNNAARELAETQSVPRLRCAVHFGDHYEYFQAGGMDGEGGSFIVGDVTINLARIISAAGTNQLLIGSYKRALEGVDQSWQDQYGVESMDTTLFMALAQEQLVRLVDLPIPGGRISKVAAYLTGPRISDTVFSIKRYYVIDKHGLEHPCFNAKFNVGISDTNTIYFGLLERDLADFKARTEDDEDLQIRVF
jgi:hypothetical protein